MTPEALTDSWLNSVLDTDVHVVGTCRIGDGPVAMNIRLTLNSDGSVPTSLIASQIVGSNHRSETMFSAMATRHLQHVLDLDSESLL